MQASPRPDALGDKISRVPPTRQSHFPPRLPASQDLILTTRTSFRDAGRGEGSIDEAVEYSQIGLEDMGKGLCSRK